MVEVRRAVAGSLAALVVLLAGLSAVVGLAPPAWGVGLACGVVLAWAVARGVRRGGGDRVGPADLVTLARATIACAVAALVTESSPRQTVLLVALATVALVLDAVDGRVARATRTQTGFGARFDGEADAFLILVLSVHVAQSYGAWVLAIGAARYAFGLAGLMLPWLRDRLPPRHWRKVVAAVQGIVLVVVAAERAARRAGVRRARRRARAAGGVVRPRRAVARAPATPRRATRPRTGTRPTPLDPVSSDDRAAWAAALEPARQAAYPTGQYVGQESFMTAGEILSLAHRARIGPGDEVLDLCCGVAGPGRLVTAETGCHYLGIDRSAAAVELARRQAAELPCRFEVGAVPPVPDRPVDVVLLLETLLAFPDKRPLLAAIAKVVRPGGRFACTVEEGRPLSTTERALMPASDTVWPVPVAELVEVLAEHGFAVDSVVDCTDSHRDTAQSLADAFSGDRPAIAARIGRRAVDDLVTAHRLWVDWLGTGRIRKLALVAVR